MMPNFKKYNHPNLINKKIMSKPKKKKKGMRTKETLNKVIEAQESK